MENLLLWSFLYLAIAFPINSVRYNQLNPPTVLAVTIVLPAILVLEFFLLFTRLFGVNCHIIITALKHDTGTEEKD